MTAFRRRRFSQKTADFRRRPQNFAETLLSHLVSVRIRTRRHGHTRGRWAAAALDAGCRCRCRSCTCCRSRGSSQGELKPCPSFPWGLLFVESTNENLKNTNDFEVFLANPLKISRKHSKRPRNFAARKAPKKQKHQGKEGEPRQGGDESERSD